MSEYEIVKKECWIDGLDCPLFAMYEHHSVLADIAGCTIKHGCVDCNRYSLAYDYKKLKSKPIRLGSVCRYLLLETSDNLDYELELSDLMPYSLSDQASRRRALIYLEEIGLMKRYLDNLGSWKHRDSKYKRYDPDSRRLTRIPELTRLGGFITELIVNDLKSSRQIRWERVLKRLPPDGVGTSFAYINHSNEHFFNTRLSLWYEPLDYWEPYLEKQANAVVRFPNSDDEPWEGKTVQYIVNDCNEIIDLTKKQINTLKAIGKLEAFDMTNYKLGYFAPLLGSLSVRLGHDKAYYEEMEARVKTQVELFRKLDRRFRIKRPKRLPR